MVEKTICDACITYNGGCCVGVRLCVHKDELKPFHDLMKNGNLPNGHSLKLWDKNDKNINLYSSGDHPCMFLGYKNGCKIYDNRPLICRMYPLHWKGEDEDDISLFLDLACPLAHILPLREITSWANDKKNKEQTTKMGDLDFDGRRGEYINITFLKKNFDALKLLEDKDLSLP
jgi:Fe-S-cluster containining protein